jgi:hypothetical protein
MARDGMPTDAVKLLRDSSSRFAQDPRDELGFLDRTWQENYLSALIRDFSSQIPRLVPATFLLGTAPLVHTACLASRTETLVFIDLRETTAVAMLSDRLRRRLVEGYGPGSADDQRADVPLAVRPEQTRYQIIGLVSTAMVGSALDALDGRGEVQLSSLRALAFAADRADEGVASLALLRNISEASQVSVPDAFPAWNPTTQAFIVAHEFAHLHVGGDIQAGVLKGDLQASQFVWELMHGTGDMRARYIQRTIDDLSPYDAASARECRQGIDHLGEGADLEAEALADIVAMMAATSLLIGDVDAGLRLDQRRPYPPEDLYMWLSTCAAVALNQAAREMGRSLTRATAKNGGHGSDEGCARALATYLFRSWTSVIAACVVARCDADMADRVNAGAQVVMAGLQCLTELRTGIETAVRGYRHSKPPPPNEFLRGAELLGLRVGERMVDRHQRIVEEREPAAALASIRASYDEGTKVLFYVGAEPPDARLAELGLPELNGDEEWRTKLWEIPEIQ